MTDRELLEAAARAAGLPPWSLPDVGHEADDWPWKWNPLVDDGDALRLAVKVGINVFLSAADTMKAGIPHTLLVEESIVDKGACAATRRAIVRAAASLAPQATQGEQR